MDWASVVAKLETFAADKSITDAERAEARKRIEAIKAKHNTDPPKPNIVTIFFDGYTDSDLFGSM